MTPTATDTTAATAAAPTTATPRRSSDRQVVATRLLRSAARTSYDPLVEVDWEAPLAPDLHGMSPEWSTLWGTPLWDRLDEEQQVRLTQHEFSSISGVGIWFEMILMQLVLRDVYDDDPSQPHVQFALTEIADECRHSVMFARMAERYGCPAYGPSKRSRELGRLFKTLGKGPAAYAAILVAEEVLDILQRDLVKDERVQPLSRAVSRIHVVEEARHMRFAREEVARRAPGLSRWERSQQRTVVAVVADIITRNLVQPQVYAAVGLDPDEAHAVARANQHHTDKLRSSAASLTGFLREVGLLGGPSERIWRHARLL